MFYGVKTEVILLQSIHMKNQNRSLGWRVLWWLPRILSILFIAFISLFALDVFSEGYVWYEFIVALIMHLIPTIILASLLIIAWKEELLGAAIFYGAIIALVFIVGPGSEDLIGFIVIALPVFVIGTLFLILGIEGKQGQSFKKHVKDKKAWKKFVKKNKTGLQFLAIGLGMILLAMVGTHLGWHEQLPSVQEENKIDAVEVIESEIQETVAAVEIDPIVHLDPPEEVRGLYWTGSTAGSYRADELLEYMLATGINSVVIDLKMDNGQLAFDPVNDDLDQYMMDNPTIDDLEMLLEKLADAGIYRIARIAVMRDSAFAYTHPEVALRYSGGSLWQDNTGMIWVDPAASLVAEQAIALGQEAYDRGFDELQFDYVRFASDGSISAIVYPAYDGVETKYEVMYRFFKTVGGHFVEQEIPVSFDTFGITCWSMSDFNIGQRLVDVYPYTTYISPMVYPSHYPEGFEGYGNPAVYPYEIVYSSMMECTNMIAGIRSEPMEEIAQVFRPWIQDFDIGAVYTADLIEAQIKAARDSGSSGWILWNARNVYEPANYL
jgi:hypothetical protein